MTRGKSPNPNKRVRCLRQTNLGLAAAAITWHRRGAGRKIVAFTDSDCRAGDEDWLLLSGGRFASETASSAWAAIIFCRPMSSDVAAACQGASRRMAMRWRRGVGADSPRDEPGHNGEHDYEGRQPE